MSITLARQRPAPTGFVVFGLDQHECPRAAWFSSQEHVLAQLAANRPGFRLLECGPGLPAHMPDWLPWGRRLESGRLVIPRVRWGVYQKLCDLEDVARVRRLSRAVSPAQADQRTSPPDRADQSRGPDQDDAALNRPDLDEADED
jgi:hypothetical protein